MNFFSKKSNKDKKNDKKRSDSASGSSNTSSASKTIPTKPVLGVPLPVAVANNRCYDNVPLPAVMRACIDYVEQSGLEMEGIYRVSAPISRLDDLERQANLMGKIEFVDAHEAAGLLKRFLRQIPGHILLFGQYVPEDFEKVAEMCKCESNAICKCPAAAELKKMLENAPKEHYYLLAYVFQHALHVIQHEKKNKMTLGALGVLLQAMFSVSRNIIKIFMMNAAPALDADPNDTAVYLFTNLPIKRYARPLTCSEVNTNFTMTQEDINIEIAKQQTLLEEVNDQVLELRKQNKDTKLKQQEMWDVQQCITLLKRKLKNMSRINGSTDDENASTSSDTSSIIEPGPLLERQLIAIQKVLIEDIVGEENEIAQLQQKLFDLQADLDTHKDQVNQSSKVPFSTNGTLFRRPRMAPPPPPQVPIWNPVVVSSIGRIAQDLVEPLDSDCNECHRQEVRKNVLVSQIAKMRDECAQLRAKLDDSLETKQAVVVAAADDFGTSNVLITKL